MERLFWFDCTNCEDGRAECLNLDLTAENENEIYCGVLDQATFICNKCGKKYYCGDWQEFCIDEDEL